MPDTAATMQRHLGLSGDDAFYKMDRLTVWGGLKPGTTLKKSISLFPRVDLKNKPGKAQADSQASGPGVPIKPEITIDDFAKVDLRVATVISAQPVPKARKLLQLEVDLGEKNVPLFPASPAATNRKTWSASR